MSDSVPTLLCRCGRPIRETRYGLGHTETVGRFHHYPIPDPRSGRAPVAPLLSLRAQTPRPECAASSSAPSTVTARRRV